MRTDEQKENIRKWVKALRSGRYVQGKGQLKGAGYCCLGVACELELAEPNSERSWAAFPTRGSMEKSMGLCPDPKVRTNNGYITVARLNDEENYSFEEIADAIERTYLKEEE